MTREEAIYRLKNTAWLGTDKDREETEQAVDMAIEALQAEPKTREWIKFEDYLPKYKQCVLFLERVNGEQEYHIGIGVFYGLDDNPYVKGIQDNVVMTNRQWHVKDSRIIAWYPLPPFELEKASAPIYGIADGIILE